MIYQECKECKELLRELNVMRSQRDKAIELLHMLDNQEARHPDVAAFLNAIDE